MRFQVIDGNLEDCHIDPKKIPNVDYEIGCSVLAASIRRLLADPKIRAEYEAWKKARSGSTSATT